MNVKIESPDQMNVLFFRYTTEECGHVAAGGVSGAEERSGSEKDMKPHLVTGFLRR